MSIDAAEQIEKFQEFIEQYYLQQLHEHMNRGLQFILLDFFDLTKYDNKLADQLLEEPEETIKAAEMALEQFEVKKGFRVRFRNLPKSQEIYIRNLRSKHLLKFIAMEGIIRQSSEVRPQAVSAKFECPSCGNTITMPQVDQQFREPSRCSCGRKGKFRLLSKDLVDVQRLVIEESPENLEGGAQPKRMQIFLREDLVEPRMERRTTPGTRIIVNGALYEVPIQTKTGATSTRFDLAMQANYIEPVEEDYSEINITPEDEKEIKKLAKDKDIHNRIIRSIAPSIYGHERIKEAILLQLFGGIRKTKKDGTIVRGDLHVLLVGDPGCIVGESQIALYNGGMEKIENLGTKHLENINLSVTTIGEEGYDLATKFHRYEKKLVLKVGTETGKHLICTLDHQLLSKEGWKRADCFQLGEAIRVIPEISHTVQEYVPTHFTYAPKSSGSLKKVVLPQKITPELAALYGYIIGDGNIHSRGYTITCYVSDAEKELIEPLSSLWKNTFSVTPSLITRQAKMSMIYNGNGTVREVQSVQMMHLVEINSKHVAQNLSFLSSKRVPQSIFQSPKEVVASFIRWLFEADGCAFGNGRGRTSIQLKSRSPGLLQDVQLLLLYFGIQSRIVEDNLCIRRAYDMDLYIKHIGFASEKKNKALDKVQEVIDKRQKRRKGNQNWEKIVSIDFAGVRDVYDFEVPKSHMFVANGIVSHNCGKSQMLTFVNNTAPKSRYVAGRSASGAGLTCSVVKDEFLRGWALEAGAMVLADKGILVLDEMDKISKEDTSALHEAMEQQHISIAKANIQACYSEDTEVLTEKGWKKYFEVKNRKIAQYDPGKRTITLLSHKGLFVYDYSPEMYSFKNRRHDILVTPNHKMLFKEIRHKDYQFLEADKIPYSRVHFLNSGNFIGSETKYFYLPPIKHKQNRTHPKYTQQEVVQKIPMDLWLEFLGYFVSEGGFQGKSSFGIPQKKKEHVDKIRKCLLRLSKYIGYTLSESKDKEIYTRFQITNTQLSAYLRNNCGKNHLEKKLPLNLSLLSKRQLQILFDAMMLGDGESTGKSYSSTSLALIDIFQAIACLVGKSASKHIVYKQGYRKNRVTLYRVCLSDRFQSSIKMSLVQKKKYKGKVYCFATQTGFFVTRRNGKIAIQGNTLRTQTSILGAANPKLGRFDPFTPIPNQIDMPPALINRFDLIFVMRDIPNKELDGNIATRVLQSHAYKDVQPELEAKFIRKYLAYAKQKIFPVLTDQAVEAIKKFYVELRSTGSTGDGAIKPIPISARQLEAIVRLAEASARIKLKKEVEEEDALRAISLMKYCMTEVGMDPETGKIDLDRMTTGISASVRGRIIDVKEVLYALSEEKQGGPISIEDDLKPKVFAKGITEKKLEEAVDMLKRAGDFYEPKKGWLQKI